MSYCGNCEPNYLGFMTTAALAPVAAATGPLAPLVLGFAEAFSALDFHIGAGRKEADKIVPEQIKLGDILTQVDRIFAGQPLTISDLNALNSQLRGIWQKYLDFLYQPAFTQDGDTRASDQSRATMEPQVTARLQGIADRLNAAAGRPQVPVSVQSGGAVANLEFRTTTDLSLPQAGIFQPGTVQNRAPGVVGPTPTDNGLLMKMLLAGGVVLLLSRR
jgi:hypothetical protein